MTEIWKKLKYHDEMFENYEVSTYGNIRHINNKINRSFNMNNGGYYRMTIYICYDGDRRITKEIKPHIAVASTFIDNIHNKTTVNHRDGNKTNNAVTNLEWADYDEQQEHSMNILGNKNKFSEKMRNRFSKTILQYSLNNELINAWNSTREVEKEKGFCHEIISACARGKRKSAYGYKWRYAA